MKKYKNACNSKYKTNRLLILALLWVGISSCNIMERNSNDDSHSKTIPVTHKIQALSFSDLNYVQIKNLEVQIVRIKDDKFSITYDVAGQIELPGNQALVIDKVYMAEYLNKNPDLDYFRVIDITPITKYVGKKNSGQEFEYFRFKNEYTIRTVYLDSKKPERVKFICGDKEQIIELK